MVKAFGASHTPDRILMEVKSVKFRKFLMVGAVAAAVAATGACSGDDSNALPPVPTATAATSATTSAAADDSYEAQITNGKQRPDVTVLNEMLQKALDPKIPAKDKTELVEGSQVDPDLFNQLVKAAKDNPDITYEIKKPVISAGPNRASVKVEVRIPDNPPTKIDASIVYEDGRWKLSKQTVCPLLTANDVETALCADESAGAASSSKKSAARSTTPSR